MVYSSIRNVCTNLPLKTCVVICTVIIISAIIIYSPCQMKHTCDKSIVIKYGHRNILINRPFTDSDPELSSRFNGLVARKVEPLNEDLVAIAREVIEPPSKHPQKVRSQPKTPQNRAVLEILNRKEGGFFVECGANDGELSSNTLFLEKSLGWGGLLVETDYFMYTQVKARSRNAHTANVCIGTTRHPSMVEITDSDISGGRIMPNGSYTKADVRFGKRLGEWSPCFPFDTLMAALNRKHVDYFSLDVEGYELDILRTISWDDITIDILSVEYVMIAEGKEALRSYMEGVGYVTYDDIQFADSRHQIYVTDYIFVRKDILVKSGLKSKLSTNAT